MIQQGDSDPEFLGRFDAVQTLPAFTAEELLAMELGRQRELIPRYAMEGLVGPWSLQVADHGPTPVLCASRVHIPSRVAGHDAA